MTTTFFRLKKLAKYFIKSILPHWLYTLILSCYRTIIFTIPTFLKKRYALLVFKNKTLINIPTGNFDIYVDPKNGHTDVMLYINKSRDKEVTDVMDIYLQEGSVFVDIGANIGYETLWGAKIVGDQGKVVSFEPVPIIASQLSESVIHNKLTNVTLVKKGVSDVAEKVTIFLNDKDAGSSSILNNQPNAKEFTIETITLDEALKDTEKIDLIKIDVEGYEPQVLYGADMILKKFTPPLVFEYQPYLYESKYTNILSLLTEQYGYTLYHIETTNKVQIKNNQINDFTKLLIEEKSLVNILAVPKKYC